MTDIYTEVSNTQIYQNDQHSTSETAKQPSPEWLETQLNEAEEYLGESCGESTQTLKASTNNHTNSHDDYELIEEGYDLQTHGGGSIEPVPGFELSRPMIEAIGQDATEPLPADWANMQDAAANHYSKDFFAESVCGNSDDRVKINEVTSPPFRMIAKLVITAADGKQYGGTGWFISPRTVVTAGHCLFSNRSGGWAKSIEVIPGMNARHRPFGSATGTVFRSVRGWVRDNEPAQDYGCILLPESSPLGNKVGYFGFAALKEDKLDKLLVNTSGYPGDKSFGTQWFNAGRITDVLPRRLEYMIDTFGGQSGSSVWRYEKTTGSRIAVGIHNYGGCDNKASRINQQVFELMHRWKRDGM